MNSYPGFAKLIKTDNLRSHEELVRVESQTGLFAFFTLLKIVILALIQISGWFFYRKRFR